MNLAIDALIIVVVVLVITSAAKKGLIRSVMRLIKVGASIITAYAFTPVLSEYIRDRFLIDRMTENISETLKGWALDTNSDLFDLDRLSDLKNADFVNVLDRYGVDLNTISGRLRGLFGVGENEVNSLARDIAEPTSNMLASAISFILIFAAVFVLLSLLTALLDAIFKLPVLSGINKVFGIAFGIIEAAVLASVIAVALSALVTALGPVSPEMFGAQVIDRTVVCRFLLDHNALSFIKNVLAA